MHLINEYFIKLHIKKLKYELDTKLANSLPILPPKRFFYNKEREFLEERMRGLNDYLKSLITMHEAIDHPTLQRFLEIDTNYNPNYEYESIKPSQIKSKPVQISQPKYKIFN